LEGQEITKEMVKRERNAMVVVTLFLAALAILTVVESTPSAQNPPDYETISQINSEQCDSYAHQQLADFSILEQEGDSVPLDSDFLAFCSVQSNPTHYATSFKESHESIEIVPAVEVIRIAPKQSPPTNPA
jgi:hypothetical protein